MTSFESLVPHLASTSTQRRMNSNYLSFLHANMSNYLESSASTAIATGNFVWDENTLARRQIKSDAGNLGLQGTSHFFGCLQ